MSAQCAISLCGRRSSAVSSWYCLLRAPWSWDSGSPSQLTRSMLPPMVDSGDPGIGSSHGSSREVSGSPRHVTSGWTSMVGPSMNNDPLFLSGYIPLRC